MHILASSLFCFLIIFTTTEACAGEIDTAASTYDITKSDYYTFLDNSKEGAEDVSHLKKCLSEEESPYNCISQVMEQCQSSGTLERCAYRESSAWRKMIAESLIPLFKKQTIKDDVATSQQHWEIYASSTCEVMENQVQNDSIQARHQLLALCTMRQDAHRAIDLFYQQALE